MLKVSCSILLLISILGINIPNSIAASFIVDDISSTRGDEPDANVGDGICKHQYGNCSLRAAIQEANLLNEATTIYMGPQGSITIGEISDPIGATGGEDEGVIGDLDIHRDITIIGHGRTSTTLAGPINRFGFMGDDRIFHVLETGKLTLKKLTVTQGKAIVAVDENRGLETSDQRDNSSMGGAIYNQGELYLEDVLIDKNCVAGLGAGIAAGFNSYTEIESSTISRNIACAQNNAIGGGIGAFEPRAVVIRNSVIESNARDSYLTKDWSQIDFSTGVVQGGGIHFLGAGELIIENTLIQNHWTIDGGGIYFGLGKLRITNSTIQDNYSNRSGGGLFFVRDEVGDTRFIKTDEAHLVNVTIANNGAGAREDVFLGPGAGIPGGSDTGGVYGGGGIFVNSEAGYSNTLRIVNSLIDDNTRFITVNSTFNRDENCVFATGAMLSSFGGSLDGDSTCGLSHASDKVGVDAQLQPLTDHGGATDTLAVSSTSPAVDGALSTHCPSTDQRGFARTASTCDIGAFEEAAPIPLPEVFPQVYAVQPGGMAAGTLTTNYIGPGEVRIAVTDLLTKGDLLFNHSGDGIPSSEDFIYQAQTTASGNDSFQYRACVDAYSICSDPATISFIIGAGTVEGVAQVDVIADGGVTVSDVIVVNRTELSAPVSDVDYDHPLGVIFFSLNDIPSYFNGIVDVTLQFPAETEFPFNAEVRKLDINGQWRTVGAVFESGTSDNSAVFDLENKTVTIRLRDNDIFDNNGTQYMINDPIAIGVPKSTLSQAENSAKDIGRVPGGIGTYSMVILILMAIWLYQRSKVNRT